MFLKRLVLFSVLLGALALTGIKSTSAAELIYFHSEACPVCDRWNEEVGTIYPKTPESKLLPLRKQSVHDAVADDLAFINAVGFTPTFVVVEDGKEVGRITGYVNDMFFWQHVEGMLGKIDTSAVANGRAANAVTTCGDGGMHKAC